MKKLVLLVAVATTFAFASCGNETAKEEKCDKPCEATEAVEAATEAVEAVETVVAAEEVTEAVNEAVEVAEEAAKKVEEVVAE